ncbi:MAG: hypothetical protein KC776_01190, partial [Myxococcales bacterium]|nr:hypothetical protein [Myxococcales bacterium]
AGGGGTAGSAGSSGSAGTGGIVDAGWDATGSSNSCCGPATTPGCNDPSIEQCVCSKDGACCYSAWDAICVNEVKKYNCNGCLCIDKCSGAGATKCVGDEVQECAMQSTGCLDWQTDTVCPTGEVCMDGSAGAACAPPPPSAENCSEAFPLQSGTNSIAWTASVADYLTSPTSCQPSFANLDGPDLVLKYVPATTSTVTMSFAKPTDTRWVAIVSDAACGTTTETACASEWAASTMDLTFLGTAGTTYYIYVRDTDSGTSPLDNPLGVTVTET